MLTTLTAITPASLARPAYLTPVLDPDFGSTLQRVTPDAGTPWPVIGGYAALDSRHHYSKDQPFSHDGRLVKLQQKGGDPGDLIVDAATWQPVFSDRGSDPTSKLLRSSHETRWRPGHANEIVSTFRVPQGLRVAIWDVLSGAVLWQAIIPSDDPSFGWAGEGQISDDGRWTVFSTRYGDPASQADYLVVVDLERGRVGVRNDLAYATRAFPSSSGGVIGNVGISPLGNFAEVKLSGTEQYSFVLDIDHDTLFTTRRSLNLDALRMGPPEARGLHGASLGATAWLSHPDMNISTDGREVIVGGGRGFEQSAQPRAGKELGNVLMVDLKTGIVEHVSPGSSHLGGARAASMQHGSGRAYQRRGWHLCSFEMGNVSAWGAGEVMWVKLDGSHSVERLTAHRSMETGIYRGEAHPVASPDGTRVMFASNWMGKGATGASDLDDVKAYVVTQGGGVIEPPPPPPIEDPYEVRPFSADYAIFDKRNGRLIHPADCVAAMNRDALKREVADAPQASS